MSTNIPADSESASEEKLSNRSGGLTALSGFFFQFVGTFAHIIGDLQVEVPASDVPGARTETLFSIEVGDSDYQRTQKTKVQLVQFKYSSDPTNNKIYEEELYEIVRTLRNAKERISSDKQLRVERILATNRPLGEDSQEVWDAAMKSKNHPLFKRNSDKKKNRHGFKGYLQECEYREESSDSWFETIDKWGRTFGMSCEEIDKGVLEVSGQFLKRVLDGRRTFGIEAIEKDFVGFESPHKMPMMHQQSVQEMPSFINRLDVPDILHGGDVNVLRTRLFAQLQQALMTHALVVLSGDGGNGKSTLLAATLRQGVKEKFVTGRKISELPSDWIPRSVSNWRNAPPDFNSTQTVKQAIHRLENFGNSRPILLAALDALDEVDLDKNTVGNLIGYFEELENGPKPPPATLVLTCRNADEFKRLRGEPGHRNLLSANPIKIGELIDVRAFEEVEIMEMLEQGQTSMTSNLRSRLKQEFSRKQVRNSPDSEDSSDTETMGKRPRVRPVDPQVREAIKHPIIWGEIFGGHFTPQEQESILSGDPKLLGDLAEEIVKWFAAKCEVRTTDRVSEDYAARIMFLVARHCGERSGLSYHKDWEKPLHEQPHLLNHAPAVAKQAISAGLVKGEFSSFGFLWEWRHSFLMAHLVAKHASQDHS